MAGDAARIRHDREPVTLRHGYEVRHWCRVFGCTEEELRAAVAAVGESATRVREFLARNEQVADDPPAPHRRLPGP